MKFEKNDSHLFIFFVKGVLADVLLVLFLEMEKNNIWRLNVSDAKSYEWNSEKLYFLILYLVQKKKQYLGMSRFLSHYYNSTWQLLTDSDRNECISHKKENYCFSGNWHLSMDEDEGGGNQLTQDA